MAVHIEFQLPGGSGTATAENAAEESTLRQIVSLLAQSSGQKIDTSSVKAVGQNSKVASRGLIGLSGTIGQASAAAGAAAASFQRASTSFVISTKSIFTSFGRIGSAGSSFASSIEGLTSPISKLAGSFPLIGGIASAAISGITAILTETAGNYQKMQQSGASFGYSMIETRDIANNAGLSLGMLSNVVNKARADMALFGGTTSQGGRLFANLNKEVQAGKLGDDLLRMGIGYEEQSEMLAEVMGDFVRAGVDVRNLGENSEVVTRRLATMAIQQKKMAQFNGITLEQQREQIKQQKSNVQLQVSLSGMAPAQRKAAEAFAAQFKTLGPVAEQAFTEVMVHGQAVNDSTGIFLSQFPELASKMNEFKAGIEDGTISDEDVTSMWASIDPKKLEAQLAGAGELIKAAMAANIPGAEGLASTYIAIRDWGTKIKTGVADAITKDAVKLTKEADETTKLMGSTIKLAKQIQESLSTFATVALKSDFMESVQRNVSGFNTNVADLMDTFTQLGDDETLTLGDIMATAAENGNTLAQTFLNLNAVLTPIIKALGFLGVIDPAAAAGSAASSTAPAAATSDPRTPRPIGDVFGGDSVAFARGGAFSAGDHMILGDKGPEEVTFDQSGVVTPNNKLYAMMEKAVSDSMKKYGQPTSASSLPDIQSKLDKMMAEMEKYGTTVSQDTSQLAETNMQKLLPGPPAGVDDNLRKRQVEDAMLALPGLLMDNIKAVNQVSQLTAELPHELQAVIA